MTRLIPLLLILLAVGGSTGHAQTAPPEPPAFDGPPKRIAAIVTVYRPYSHADTIVSRILKTETLDNKGRRPQLELVSLYVDQTPETDVSAMLARGHDYDYIDRKPVENPERKIAQQTPFTIYGSIREALTLGGDELAVDGVLLIAEHGDYPKTETGNKAFPKRRFFDETVAVFRDSGRVVPVFMDKHVADNWQDIKHILDTAQEMKIPMAAGSVVPLSPRIPALDVTRGTKLDQMVVLSYHTLDSYGFHALEFGQSLAERRAGGETGIKAVQTLSGDALWSVIDSGRVDVRLFDAAMSLQTRPQRGNKPFRDRISKGSVMIIEYRDGFTMYVFTLNGVVDQWTAAWKSADGTVAASGAYLAEADPYVHFALLSRGLETMMHSGKPGWPLERTALVSGALDELLRSQTQDGARIETPFLDLRYDSHYDWVQPGPMFPRRKSAK